MVLNSKDKLHQNMQCLSSGVLKLDLLEVGTLAQVN